MEFRDKIAAPFRILIADSDHSLLTSTSETLKCQGWECICASDAELVKEYLKEDEFDVLVADFKISADENMDLLRIVSDRSPYLPIIIITGNPSMDSVIASLKYEIFDYIPKTTETDYLVKRVKEAAERKRLNSALSQSEDTYRALTEDVLEYSNVGIFILDSNFIVRWMNSAMERYFGLEREETIDIDMRYLISDKLKTGIENGEGFAEKVLGSYAEDIYIKNINCHILPGGGREERWLEHWSQPIRSGLYGGGRVEHYANVTELKKAEQALELSESIYREAIENAKGVPYRLDMRTDEYTFIGAGAEKLLGIPVTKLNRRTLISLIDIRNVTDPHSKKVIEYDRNSFVNGEIDYFQSDLRIRTPQGEMKWLSDSAIPIHDQRTGRVIASLGILQDITQRKKYEEALRESAEQYRKVFEYAGNAFLIIDENDIVIDANQATCNLLGFKKEMLLNYPVQNIINPAFHEFYNEFKKNIDANRQFFREVEYTRIRGGISYLDIWGTVIMINGKPHYLSSIREVTKQKIAEAKVKKNLAKMEFLSKAALEFVDLSPDEDFCDLVGTHLLDMAENSIVVISMYEPESNSMIVRCVKGINTYLNMIINALGANPVGMKFPLGGDVGGILAENSLVHIKKGIYELTNGKIPQDIAEFLEKKLRIKEIHSMNILRKGMLVGNASLILKKSEQVLDIDLIETYINQASIMLLRRQAEEKLRESQVKFQKVFQLNPDGLVISRLDDGTIVEVNKGFEIVTGYTREETIGRTADDIRLWVDLNERKRFVRILSEFGECDNFKSVFRLKNGDHFSTSISSKLIEIEGKSCVVTSFKKNGFS